MTTIRASVLHAAGDLRLEMRTLPPLSADDVQVAVQATGLCGSDLHYFSHFRNGDMAVREPLTLGHESAGTVTALGADVVDLCVGDRVALEVGQPCEWCAYCRSGRYNICRRMRFRSSAKTVPHAQGTLQEVIVHPARWCHKLPPDMPLALGALVEPLSVAQHASDRAGLPDGVTILVLGAGTVGLLCAALAKVAGRRVVIADIRSERVRFAVENGFADASVVVPVMRRSVEMADRLAFAREVASMTTSACVDGRVVGEMAATFECTGVESCLHVAIYATAPGGRVMLVGMGKAVQTLPISAAASREVDLLGVFRYANTYPKMIRLLASKNALLPDLERVVTHRYSGLDAVPDAFATAGRAEDDQGKMVLKVMVEW